jgi:hypothetical protein
MEEREEIYNQVTDKLFWKIVFCLVIFIAFIDGSGGVTIALSLLAALERGS